MKKYRIDSPKHDDFRNDFETKFYDLDVTMQHIIDEHDAKSSEQVHPTDTSEQGTSNLHNSLKLPAISCQFFPVSTIAGLVSVTSLR